MLLSDWILVVTGLTAAISAGAAVVAIRRDGRRWEDQKKHEAAARRLERLIVHYPSWYANMIDYVTNKRGYLARKADLLGLVEMIKTRGVPMNPAEDLLSNRLRQDMRDQGSTAIKARNQMGIAALAIRLDEDERYAKEVKLLTVSFGSLDDPEQFASVSDKTIEDANALIDRRVNDLRRGEDR